MTRTRKSQVPAVPSGLDMQQRQFFEAIKQALEVGEGLRGDPMDRNLTARDLVDIGLARKVGVGRLAAAAGEGWRLEGALADLVNLTTPPPVSGLKAVASATAVLIRWDAPRYANHALTQVWRSQERDISTATLVGATAAGMWADVVGGGWSGHYWVRHVSTASVSGPFAGPVSAETPVDVEYMLEKLTGEIREDQLFEDLRSQIELISGSGEGSVNWRLVQEAQERAEAIAAEAEARAGAIAAEAANRAAAIAAEADARTKALAAEAVARRAELDAVQGVLSDLQGLAEYDEDSPVPEGVLVRHEGKLYRTLQAMAAPVPAPMDDGVFWQLVGNYASLGEVVAAQAARLEDFNTVVGVDDGRYQATVSAVHALQALISDPDAGLERVRAELDHLEYVYADDEIARSIRQAGALVRQVAGEVVSQVSLREHREATATNAIAIGAIETQLTAEFGEGLSEWRDRVRVVVDNESATGLFLQGLRTEFGNNAAEWKQEIIQTVDRESAAGLFAQAFVTEFGGSAAEWRQQMLQDVTDSEAYISDITRIEARIDGTESGLATKASIEALNEAVANEQGARAAAVNTINANLSNNYATKTDLSAAEASIKGSAVTAFTQISAKFNATDNAISDRPTTSAVNTAIGSAKTDVFGANVNQFTQINARFTSTDAAINNRPTATAMNTAINDAKADVFGASVTSFNQINTRFTSTDTAINARPTTTAMNTAINTAKTDVLGAAVSSFTQINARFSSTDTAIGNRPTVTAMNTAINTAKTDVLGAAVSSFTQIQAKFNSVDSAVGSRATITQLNTAISDEQGARAEAVRQVAAIRAGDNLLPDGSFALSAAAGAMGAYWQPQSWASLIGDGGFEGSPAVQITAGRSNRQILARDGTGAVLKIPAARGDTFEVRFRAFYASNFTPAGNLFRIVVWGRNLADSANTQTISCYTTNNARNAWHEHVHTITVTGTNTAWLRLALYLNSTATSGTVRISDVSISRVLRQSILETKEKADAQGAQWSVKTSFAQVNANNEGGIPRVGGIGLRQGTDGKVRFYVQADQFAVYDPGFANTNDNSLIPFVVENGVTYIKRASIKDADITGILTAGSIVTDSLTVTQQGEALRLEIGEEIKSSNFLAGSRGWRLDSITGNIEAHNGLFRGEIRSSNYSSGVSGYRLLPNGNVEFNSGVFRGDLHVKSSQTGARTEIESDRISVYDSSGVLRVRIGRL